MTFAVDAGQRVGVVDSERGLVRDVTQLVPGGTLLDVIERGARPDPSLAQAHGPEYRLDEVRALAPLPTPRRNLFCVGKNYRDHAVEFGRSGYDTPERSAELPERPIVFSKATTSVTGPYEDIDPHAGLVAELDYEGELGVIIGAGGRGIPRERADEHVWGYTIINDVTARDLQRDHKQWLLGKSLDGFCPMGPFAVTADEVGDVTALELRTWVNGEARQHAPIKDLIFDIPELISTISAGITLLPGDLIATGTPAGVGIGFTPPRFLAGGDVVEVTITGLGRQRNTIAANRTGG